MRLSFVGIPQGQYRLIHIKCVAFGCTEYLFSLDTTHYNVLRLTGEYKPRETSHVKCINSLVGLFQFMHLYPGFQSILTLLIRSLEQRREVLPYKYPADFDRILDGLRKAGLLP